MKSIRATARRGGHTHGRELFCTQLLRWKAGSELVKRSSSTFSRSRQGEKKVKVGVVGEIYVKYSPLGNNNLEEFLLPEGAEVVVPGTDGILPLLRI